MGVARPLGGGPHAFTLVRTSRAAAPQPVGTFSGCLDALTAARPVWADLPPGPAVMGIVNVTPDSFSDGGTAASYADAIAQGRRMLEEGAALLDIGGEFTRPGATPVSPEQEQARILPVIETLAREGARISVDTRHAATMARALDAGAAIINDVSGLRHDPAAAPLLAARKCPVILMHMRGTPQTMTRLTEYGDVGFDVLSELGEIVELAVAAGVERRRIAVDPGFGFAKTQAQSRELLQRLPLFVNLLCPIIAGMSRKSFIGEMAGLAHAQERDTASVAAAVIALSLGATIIRAHAVRATVEAAKIWRSVQD